MMRPMNPAHPADALLLDFKRAMRESMHRHDIEQGDLAEACMVDASIVSHWCSRKSRASIGHDSIALAAAKYPALVLDLLRWQATHCRVSVSPMSGSVRASLVIDHAKAMHKEGSELTGVLIGASGSDIAQWTDEQLETADRELRDVEAVVVPLRGDIDAERSRRSVVPLRRSGART